MSVDKLILRVARAEDRSSLLALEQKVVAAERPFNHSLKQNDVHYYDLEALIDDPLSQLVVADIEGIIVATGYLQIRQSKPSLAHERHGYLGFMCVSENFRRQGINQLIMKHLITWGREQGIDYFYLDVYADNQAAVRAYEKLGFQASMLEMKLTVQD